MLEAMLHYGASLEGDVERVVGASDRVDILYGDLFHFS